MTAHEVVVSRAMRLRFEATFAEMTDMVLRATPGSNVVGHHSLAFFTTDARHFRALMGSASASAQATPCRAPYSRRHCR